MSRWFPVLLVVPLLVSACGRGGGDRISPQVLDLADRAWCRGDIVRAESILQDVLKNEPDSFDAKYRLAVMHADSAPDQALHELAEAAALDPGHPGPVLFTALIHINRNDFVNGNRELDRAYELALRRRGYSVRDTTDAVRQAVADFQAERYREAATEFAAAAQADPEDGVLSFLKAESEFRGGLISDAIASIKATVEKWPDLAPARTLNGELLLARRKIDLARAEADAAVARSPGYAPALQLKGKIFLVETEHLEGAIWLWRSLLADPTRAIIHQSLGTALLRSSRPEQATAFLRHTGPLTTFHDRRLGLPVPPTHQTEPPPPSGSTAPH